MNIAFIGQKGIPALFGGVETHVEELGAALVGKKHHVCAYVRNWYTDKANKEFRGIRLIHTPTIKTKHLDAFLHSFTSCLHVIFSKADIVHFHAIGPSFFCWLPILFGKKVIVTIHSLDWKAGKWGPIARTFLRLSQKIALIFPHKIIVVSKELEEYFKNFKNKLCYIPNGVRIISIPADRMAAILSKFSVQPKKYIFFLGRFVPEKRIEWMIQAFLEIKRQEIMSGLKLVLAGGSSETDKYVSSLRSLAGPEKDIVWTGFVYGEDKQILTASTKLFVLPSSLEGFPIALLEAMSYGVPCLASDIPAHQQIITNEINGFLFKADSFDSFKAALITVLALPESQLRQCGKRGSTLVSQQYNWDNIVSQVEKVYKSI